MNDYKKILFGFVFSGIVLSLGACTFTPTTGPSAAAVEDQAEKIPQVSLVNVTPGYAQSLQNALQAKEKTDNQSAINDISMTSNPSPVMLYPGDQIKVTLWTQPVSTGGSASVTATSDSVINKTALGSYTIDDAGAVTLPYAGSVNVSKLTIPQAERRIASGYTRLGQFDQAQISIDLTKNEKQHIIVTGAAEHPSIIDWQTGGVSLADAITQAGGYKIFDTATQGRDLTANEVIVDRDGQQFHLPMQIALEKDVALNPGDSVILQHRKDIRIECLGGGWKSNGLNSFDVPPTLSMVVASGGGLDANTAQGVAVYVLSSDHKTVYRFPWDTLDGLRAAQSFPMKDGDTVYISTSPSVKFEQIVSILFGAAYPIATASAL